MKRKMFRKLLASLLAASMVVSMAACGNEDEESDQGPCTGDRKSVV